jgi:glucokinase
VAALDVGGTHASAALVDPAAGRIVDGSRTSTPLDPQGAARDILGAIVRCVADATATAAGIGPLAPWMGVAMPGPFDYALGIGRFAGVSKFESLFGVNVGAPIVDGSAGAIRRVIFVNDADAFAFGEALRGAARGHDRAVAITIGTGIGSTFLDRGRVIEDGPRVPPTGRAWKIVVDGQPLEERVSRRAILRAAAGHPALAVPGADVRELAAAARAGDLAAAAVFDIAFDTLGRGLGPWLARFDATVLVVGGSIAGSWDLLERPLVAGLAAGEPAWRGPVRRSTLGPDAALIGAVHAARDRLDAVADAPH